jgi:molybdenum cofactor cytidylyltransferase
MKIQPNTDPSAQASAPIVPVILAAGDSSRMGYPKALLPLGGEIFLSAILRKIENLGLPVPVVVLGRDADRIQPMIAERRTRILLNQAPDRGQLSSIQLALADVDPHFIGCLIWPVDQPGVPEGIVGNLVELFLSSGALMVLPRCGDKRGHPAIFHRSLFRELMVIPPSEGAKKLVLQYQAQTVVLQTAEPSTIQDIDTPEDYCRFTGETLEAALMRREKR